MVVISVAFGAFYFITFLYILLLSFKYSAHFSIINCMQLDASDRHRVY